jgi:tRNA threonylcarbamoyl adenosine modification protein (Sua5/YciO/YrdC/YwlC family)
MLINDEAPASGPLYICFGGNQTGSKGCHDKQKTVKIRIPDNKICLSLVRELGHPIISTSVYKPDEGLYNDPAEIEERFGKQLDLVIDGEAIVAEHSSIIDLTDEFSKVIRRGKGDVSLFE